MTVIRHDPAGLFPPYRCYTHATEIRGDSRLLLISGLNGYLADGVTLVCCCLLDPRWKLEIEAMAAK